MSNLRESTPKLILTLTSTARSLASKHLGHDVQFNLDADFQHSKLFKIGVQLKSDNEPKSFGSSRPNQIACRPPEGNIGVCFKYGVKLKLKFISAPVLN